MKEVNEIILDVQDRIQTNLLQIIASKNQEIKQRKKEGVDEIQRVLQKSMIERYVD